MTICAPCATACPRSSRKVRATARWRWPICWPSIARFGRSSSRCLDCPGPAPTCWSTASAIPRSSIASIAGSRTRPASSFHRSWRRRPRRSVSSRSTRFTSRTSGQVQFNPAKTQTEKFQSLSGNVDVAMMHSPVAKFAFRQDERFIASELGYAHDDYKLVVVTTKSAPRARRILRLSRAGSAARVLRRGTAKSACRNCRCRRWKNCCGRWMRWACGPRVSARMRWSNSPMRTSSSAAWCRSWNCDCRRRVPRRRPRLPW